MGKTRSFCQFPGCTKRVHGGDLCGGHYAQRLRNPDQPLVPLHTKKRPDGAPPRIVFDEVPCPVEGLEGPCHIFSGSLMTGGYGMVGSGKGKETILVHRYVWEQTRGPIPAGIFIDHQCRNRACCNIQHLRLVTPRVNATENSNSVAAICKARTHCPKGHPYNSENTSFNRRGHRSCKECNRTRSRNHWRLKKTQSHS